MEEGRGGLKEGIEEEKWTLPDVQSQSSSYEPEPNAGKSMVTGSKYDQSLLYTGVRLQNKPSYFIQSVHAE